MFYILNKYFKILLIVYYQEEVLKVKRIYITNRKNWHTILLIIFYKGLVNRGKTM